MLVQIACVYVLPTSCSSNSFSDFFPPPSKIWAKPQNVNREKWWACAWSSLLDVPLPGEKFLLAKCNISIFVDARLLWNTVLRELWLDSTVCTRGKAGWTFHWLSRLYCLGIWRHGWVLSACENSSQGKAEHTTCLHQIWCHTEPFVPSCSQPKA